MTFRVAHVNVARGYRGGERQTELLIRALAEHDVAQILVARQEHALIARFADVSLDVRGVSGHLPATMLATRGADIVHVHEGRSVYAAYLRHVLSGTPYVVTRRVDNPIRDHALAHRAYVQAARVVAVAPQVADIVTAFDPRARVDVIHSSASGLSVDPTTARAIRARHDNKLLVGHVGALDVRQKAQDDIIAVARQLCNSHPEIQFVLVGGGDDEASLRAAAAGLTNIEFTGFVENVGDYLNAFDVFILPSRREGIGSILLDAMEQRLPIIAARVGGVPEIVHDEDNGILIEPSQPDQLLAALLRLSDSAELRRRLGDRGPAYASQFTAEVMSTKYLRLYREILYGTVPPS
jgi:glycosyltransferase involved in cell wall biosynthesis